MSEKFVFVVQKETALNDFLRSELPKALDAGLAAESKSGLSNSKIRRLIFSQNVSVDAGGGFFVCKNPSFALRKNARVQVLFDQEKFFFQKKNDDIEFELDGSRVLFEDDAIIVVNKPPHFPTEPTFVQDRDNLRSAVVRYLHKKIGLDKNPPYCGIVHRLDRDTSGVILFSKRRDCNAALFKAFDSSGLENDGGAASQERVAKKVYVALCERGGSLGLANDSAGKEFSVRNYLGRVSGKSQAAKWGSVPKEKGGKFARTDFKILKEKGGRCLIEARLLTGRTHQIRVHLSQSGLPILGDVLYGGRAAERIFLHAFALELPHPESGEPLRFEAPLPDEFYQLR